MKPLSKLLPKPRLLPVVILAAALLLSIKIGTLWQERGEAFAETPAAAADPAKNAAADASSATSPADAAPAVKPKSSAMLDEQDKQNFSPDEAASLQQLAKRKAELEKRASDLDRRELLLKAVEQQLNDKIQAMHQQQAAIDTSLGKVDDQSDERLKSLVKIYETMKPADAARIFDQMDMPVLMPLLSRMKESKTAAILAAMNPDKARTITIAMVGKPAAAPTDAKPAKQVN